MWLCSSSSTGFCVGAKVSWRMGRVFGSLNRLEITAMNKTHIILWQTLLDSYTNYQIIKLQLSHIWISLENGQARTCGDWSCKHGGTLQPWSDSWWFKNSEHNQHVDTSEIREFWLILHPSEAFWSILKLSGIPLLWSMVVPNFRKKQVIPYHFFVCSLRFCLWSTFR